LIFNYIIKVFISSGIIVIVSEISKRSTLIGGLLASIPLISVLSMIWLYLDTNDTEKVKALSNSILWMVIPSMALFISLPIMINYGFNFYLSLLLSVFITVLCYSLAIIILGYFGIKI
tara:strand:- start:3652 stop:4005 length:354 start_codon:yes stop_codon:yes gene_type:complete